MAGSEAQGEEGYPAPHLRAEYPRIRRFLQASDNQAVEDAVIEALPAVSAQVAGLLVDVILNRGREAGLMGLVRVYHLLPEPEQKRVAGLSDRLSGALRAAMAEPGSKQRINAIALIGAAPGAGDAYLLATAVCDSAAIVSKPAAEALAALVSAHVAEQSRRPVGAERRAGAEDSAPRADQVPAPSDMSPSREAYLLEAVRRALSAFHIHRENRVVEAAMQLAGCSGSCFEALLGDAPARIFRAVLDVFRSRGDPALVGFVYRALASEKWREPLARAISDRVHPALIVGMVRQLPGPGEPGVREGLRSIRKLAWLRNGAAPLLSLPEELMEPAVRFVLALGWPRATKADLMRELILTGPPAAQKPALEALIGESYDPTGKLLRMVAGWGDPMLSPRAQRALPLHCDFALPGTLSAVGAPAFAAPTGEPVDFDSFWNRFDRWGATDRQRAAEAARRRIPHFNESLRFKCRSNKPAERLRAIGVVRCLKLEPHLFAEIIRLARDEDRIVRSAALTALERTPTPIKRRLLLEAVQDHDTRVQANAIEALDRLGFDHELAGLEHRLSEANNRVRGNLGRAFLRFQPEKGAEVLQAMLTSPDRSHRISGLWVVGDRGLAVGGSPAAGLRNRVEAMTRTEPDPQIRRRAAALLTGRAPGGQVGEDFFFEELSL